MGWRVIYLDGKEGRPFVECEICKVLGRDVIEPVVVFLKENQKLEDLSKEEFEKFDTCIFHCEKENKIWMENLEEYKEWKNRRERALKENMEFDEDIEIKWNKTLVVEFLENLRKYMSVVENDKKKMKYDFRRFIFPFFNEEKKKFNKPVFFRRAKFIGSFYLRDVSFTKDCYFTGVEFNQNVGIEGGTFKRKTSFSNTVFYRNVGVQEVEFQNVKFKRVSFKGLTSLDISLKEVAVFDNVEFIGKVYLLDTKFDDLNTEFVREVRFSGVIFHKFAKISSLGEWLKFERVKLKDDVRIYLNEQCKMFHFLNIDIEENSQVVLKGGHFTVLNHFVMEEVFNLSKNFVLSGITLSGLSLEIRNSILENMRFINCDFSEAAQIEIENSSLTKAEFINVDWGKITEERICKELFKKSPAKARDVYRQLKLALDNQKDHINANEFYSLEMKTYEKVLQQEADFQEKLIFSIHKSVSDFGQSWTKPLTLIIMLTIGMMGLKAYPIFFVPLFLIYFIFFLLVSILNPAIEFGLQEVIFLFASAGFFSYVLGDFDLSRNLSSELLIKSIINFLNDFAKTLNPMKLFKENGKGLEFPYTLYSIAVAFLTYQMIVAIRRRVKR